MNGTWKEMDRIERIDGVVVSTGRTRHVAGDDGGQYVSVAVADLCMHVAVGAD